MNSMQKKETTNVSNMRNDEKKRILALTGVFLPHNETITQISYKILCNLDYEIDVVCFKSSSDEYFEEFLKKDEKFKKFNIHYVNVEYSKVDINSHNFNLIKITNYMRLLEKKCIELIEKYNYQFLISFSIPNYNHYIASKVKKKCKNDIKWFASFSDPIGNNLYFEQLKKEKFRTRLLYYIHKLIMYNKKYEEVALNYSDKLIFICEELRDFITKNKTEYKEKSIIYPITYVKEWTNYIKLTAPSLNDRNKKIIFAHFGNIYGLRRIDKFLEALDQLVKEKNDCVNRIEIHQYGEIDKFQKVFFDKFSFDGLLFIHNRVNYDKCIELIKKSDVLLIFDTIVPAGEIQPFLPSKITDYLLSSKPIFAVTLKNSPLYDIINKKHICVENDTKKIKEAIIRQTKDYSNVDNNIDLYDNDYVSKKVLGNYFDIISLSEKRRKK